MNAKSAMGKVRLFATIVMGMEKLPVQPVREMVSKNVPGAMGLAKMIAHIAAEEVVPMITIIAVVNTRT